jgi:superfamily I DNA/RNA helicase
LAGVAARELQEHSFAISFVSKYRHSTPSTIHQLRKKLKLGTGKRKRKGEGEGEGEGAQSDENDAENANEECTILLSTVHGAKGLEWDTVQLLDDLAPLAAFRVTVDKETGNSSGSLWCPSWGDSLLNLWQVDQASASRAARAHVN